MTMCRLNPGRNIKDEKKGCFSNVIRMSFTTRQMFLTIVGRVSQHPNASVFVGNEPIKDHPVLSGEFYQCVMAQLRTPMVTTLLSKQ